MQRLGPAALRLRRLHAVAGATVVGLVALAVDVGVRLAGATPPVPPVLVPAALALLVAAVALPVAGLVHRSWAWSLEPDHLRVDRGVVVRRVALVPRRRVQHVSTHVGPLQRQLGLTSIQVHTAGARTPNVLVEHLGTDVAERLRRDLAVDAVPADDR